MDHAKRINDALDQEPDALGLGMHAQLDSLIVKPLGPVMKERKPLLIVVDALYECDEEGAEAVLTLLAHCAAQVPRLRSPSLLVPCHISRLPLTNAAFMRIFCMQILGNQSSKVISGDISNFVFPRRK